MVVTAFMSKRAFYLSKHHVIERWRLDFYILTFICSLTSVIFFAICLAHVMLAAFPFLSNYLKLGIFEEIFKKCVDV